MSAFALERLAPLMQHLARERTLYAPVAADRGADLHWTRVDAPDDVAIGGGRRPLYSPKQFFFAEREQLFSFEGGRFVERLPTVEPRALIGVTACDLTAIAYQDRFFASDPHYRARREATLLVGLDCSAPCEGGFCHVMDAGPAVADGNADLVLWADAERAGHVLLVVSEVGERALQGLQLPSADDDWAARRALATRATIERFEDSAHLERGMARVDAGEVSAETWEALGLQCMACSGCTNVCPTCSCFATRDEPVVGEGSDFARTRIWDSCLFEGFQREASGAHPAASPGMRVERFWFHKFSGAFEQEFDRRTCVGCGRCEAVCPGAVGVHSVMRRVAG